MNNVKLICNENIPITRLKRIIGFKNFHIACILETLEHVGNKETMYEDKIKLLENIFKLLNSNGIIIISVPVMVGLSFLVQRIIFSSLGLAWEKLSNYDLIKASIFKNTDNLEKEWSYHRHIGFNHFKLEMYLKKNFKIIKKVNIFFQIIYMIRKK